MANKSSFPRAVWHTVVLRRQRLENVKAYIYIYAWHIWKIDLKCHTSLKHQLPLEQNGSPSVTQIITPYCNTYLAAIPYTLAHTILYTLDHPFLTLWIIPFWVMPFFTLWIMPFFTLWVTPSFILWISRIVVSPLWLVTLQNWYFA